MRIAIIGGGFTGLAAAYYLSRLKYQVDLYERAPYLGGLAAGVKHAVDQELPWEWDLEQFYHHWFTNDTHVFALGQEIGVSDQFLTLNPVTAILYKDQPYQFDSPASLLRYPYLSWPDKLRTAYLLAQLKHWYTPKRSQVLEPVTAEEYLRSHGGQAAYTQLWQPLLQGKFGGSYSSVGMRWFWARIYKRTSRLTYYRGGFGRFVHALTEKLRAQQVRIHTNTKIHRIGLASDHRFQLHLEQGQHTALENYDRVIVTTSPANLSTLLGDQLPANYRNQLQSYPGLGAICLVLSLHHPLLHNIYWLSISPVEWPFLAVVEHTNLVPAVHYQGEHIVYIGNYLPPNHPHFRLSAEDLIHEFTPYLKRINPLFSPESILRHFLFRVPYAQPIVGTNHQTRILPLETPIPNLYLASMAQVYPWDRGTNYAIELGQKVANLVSCKTDQNRSLVDKSRSDYR